MKKWLKILLWIFLGVGVTSVFIFSSNQEQNKKIIKPQISIHVEGENAFISENELLDHLKLHRLYFNGQTNNDFDSQKIEDSIAAMNGIKNVKVYMNIGLNWFIKVELRKPIARVFNSFGDSFYIDEDGFMMKRSNSHTARVLVFSGEIADKFSPESIDKIINNDSLKSNKKIDEIYRISSYVCKESLMSKLIGQVYLEKNGDFILIPLVGDQKIIFGSANSAQEVKKKFDLLSIFYKEAMPYEGWDKYDEISVKYEGQIVCRKRTK
jgi:cell division protein FtsQ